MKGCAYRIGVTLLEMLVVVAVVVILVSITVSVATRIDNQARENLVRNSLALVDAALQQFSDYEYEYKNPVYRNFDFPLDCTDDSNVPTDILLTTLKNEFGTVPIISGTHDPNDSSSEGLYFFLSRVPECRKTLDKIDASLITNLGSDGRPININVGGRVYPLLRIIDPWGRTLRYDYYNEMDPNPDQKRNFPLIISAGPDRIFGTADDLTNR